MGAVSTDIDNINKNSNNPSTFDKLFNGSIEKLLLKGIQQNYKYKNKEKNLKLDYRSLWYGRMGEPTEKKEGRIPAPTTRGYIRY